MLYKGFSIVTGTAAALSGRVIYRQTFIYYGDKLVYKCETEKQAMAWVDGETEGKDRA